MTRDRSKFRPGDRVSLEGVIVSVSATRAYVRPDGTSQEVCCYADSLEMKWPQVDVGDRIMIHNPESGEPVVGQVLMMTDGFAFAKVVHGTMPFGWTHFSTPMPVFRYDSARPPE